MAPGSDSSKVYRFVIDSVVARLKDEFAAANVDESVLLELRSKWEDKLIQQGLITDNTIPEEIQGQIGLTEPQISLKHEVYDDDAVQGMSGQVRKRVYASDNYDGGNKFPRPDAYLGYYPPQHDGPGDDNDSVDNNGGTYPSDTYASAVKTEPNVDELSEDDSEEIEEEEVENLLIGQFEKVNKVKFRRHVVMKDCVFHLGGKDYLVKKCTGDFMWV
uniref:Uncharacterized protein n=1 Tax=Polytomella parva TaxID=51329 RepID=A0A7S0YCX7_9CHLO|mmetsp:Transcript_10015/g.18590  ORF Transcript_10015/g.18590 Transcript_10015/m.18590 type:complete len:217 (+) Transcript_10015:114-764(+)|eukprot:CAMPEP_0175063108 /NCGR_PEP_ID=MMETSP0052_2-20121109/14556_1 /TAXON_ID=51329 ORGANISM="Polytomella parva, Strain SAG 63-3" /NCGR_SAMPLE_ID=MMETSP0052_2 /ASSEMBLY_ACC=CAM_ASM_000194 /LENGTH=216 /DNA_ID=CAMNT_0016329235 /DNA_START=103 /DNA_END=753 /DNA_ORIENTATION=+